MGRVKTFIDKNLRAHIVHLSNNSHDSEKTFQVDNDLKKYLIFLFDNSTFHCGNSYPPRL